jgi:hypothetical protein
MTVAAAPETRHRNTGLPPGAGSTTRALLTRLRGGIVPGDTFLAPHQRAAVAAGTSTDATWAAPLLGPVPVDSSVIGAIQPRLIAEQAGLTMVPLRSRLADLTTKPVASWVAESGLKPVARASFTAGDLAPRKATASTAITDELEKLSDGPASAVLRRLLANSVVDLVNTSMLDATAGSTSRPPGLLNGVSIAAAGATPAASVAALVNTLLAAGVSPDNVVILAGPLTIAVIAGSDPMTASTGRVLGMATVPVGSGIAGDTAIVLDRSRTFFAWGDLTADLSKEAPIALDDAPTGASPLTSAWQNGLIVLLVEAFVAWRAAAGAVVAGLVK